MYLQQTVLVLLLLQQCSGYIPSGWIATEHRAETASRHGRPLRQRRIDPAHSSSRLHRPQPHYRSFPALASSANWTPEDLPSNASNIHKLQQQQAVTQPQQPASVPQQAATSAAATQPPNVPVTEPVRDVSYSETTKRSLVKAVGWRLTAALITLTSGLLFSKDLSTALKLVGSDFVTKSGFMFLGERVWNKVNWGKGKIKGKGDGAKRSLAKALVWRVFAAGNTLFCGAILAGNFAVALKIAGSDTVIKTLLFYIYERIWARVEWGKEYDLEFVI